MPINKSIHLYQIKPIARHFRKYTIASTLRRHLNLKKKHIYFILFFDCMFLLGLVCDDHTRFVLKTIHTDDELLWGIVMRLVENELRL